jgi:hypothetical protein
MTVIKIATPGCHSFGGGMPLKKWGNAPEKGVRNAPEKLAPQVGERS